jgi:hypothetical protein
LQEGLFNSKANKPAVISFNQRTNADACVDAIEINPRRWVEDRVESIGIHARFWL